MRRKPATRLAGRGVSGTPTTCSVAALSPRSGQCIYTACLRAHWLDSSKDQQRQLSACTDRPLISSAKIFLTPTATSSRRLRVAVLPHDVMYTNKWHNYTHRVIAASRQGKATGSVRPSVCLSVRPSACFHSIY